MAEPINRAGLKVSPFTLRRSSDPRTQEAPPAAPATSAVVLAWIGSLPQIITGQSIISSAVEALGCNTVPTS